MGNLVSIMGNFIWRKQVLCIICGSVHKNDMDNIHKVQTRGVFWVQDPHNRWWKLVQL